MSCRFVIAALLLSACTTDGFVRKPGSAAVDTATSADTAANNDTAAPDEPERPSIALSLSLEPDCTICGVANIRQSHSGPITIWMGEEGTSLSPWLRVEADTEVTLPLLELRADTRYTVFAQRSDQPDIASERLTLSTGPLPADFPPITLTAHTPEEPAPGITVMTIVEWTPTDEMDRNFLVAVDEAGEVIWYHRLFGLNLGLHIDDLQRIYTSQTATQALRVDPFGRTTTTWEAADLGIDTTHHEVRPTDDGGLAVLTTELRTVPGWTDEASGWTFSFDIIGDIFATFDALGHQIWSWSLLDHINPIDHHTPDLHMTFWMMPPYDDIASPKDWSHGNAMVPNGSGWLGSFRNLDWLIQVDPDTDEIEWIFGPGGDFELAEGGRWFSRQHAPEVQAGGNILLYDNGNDRVDRSPGEQPFSRVVEYQLDLETGLATEIWSYDGGVPRVYCPIVGDVDTLDNDNHLITDGAIYAGTVYTEDDIIPHFSGRVREIAGTVDPRVVWELQVGTPDDIHAQGWLVYRSIRTPSLYPAATRP